jgi:putative Mg2+ transporter-C (MgtC) family protein
MPVFEAGLDLLAAVGLGASIGFERQWRQRLAGLRRDRLKIGGGRAKGVFFASVL